MGVIKWFLPRRDQIPKSLFTRVNFIVRMWSNPCDAPWVLYAETMWPAALEAFITLIDFGLADLARNIFRPAGLMKGPGGERGKGRRPKLTRRIQRKFGPLRKLQDRKIGNGLKFMWIVDTRLQQLLWYFLLADVLSEFLYRWTSGIYCTFQCQAQSASGAGLAHNVAQQHLALSGWSVNSYPIIDYERGNVTMTSVNFFVDPDVRYNVAAGATVRMDAHPGEVSCRLIARNPLTVIDSDGPVAVTVTNKADLVVSAEVAGADVIQVEFQSTFGNYWVEDAYVSILAFPAEGMPLCPT